MNSIWPKARDLDMCQPGPDFGWKERADKEKDRNSLKLQGKTSDSNGDLAAEAQLAYNELKFAVDFFKDWINNNMLTELPDSVSYLDAVDEIHTLSQQADELTTSRRTKTQALARLQAIKTGLDKITADLNKLPKPLSQPDVGSPLEKQMLSFYKQYQATSDAVSNTTTIDNSRNDLAIAKEKLVNLNKLMDPSNPTSCPAERIKKGWSVPGGPTSTFNGATEKDIYCDAPIAGGYDHESFTHANDGGGGLFSVILGAVFAPATGGASLAAGLAGGALTHQGAGRCVEPYCKEVPYVNAKKVLEWRGALGLFGHHADIQMSCNIIWKANVLDYKGNLPGVTNTIESYVQLPNDAGSIDSGTCTIQNITTGATTSESDVTQQDCLNATGTWVADQPQTQTGQ
jgi:hypothetical protein